MWVAFTFRKQSECTRASVPHAKQWIDRARTAVRTEKQMCFSPECGHPGGHIRGSMGSEQGEDAWRRNRNMIVSVLHTKKLIWWVVSSLLYLNHHTAVALNRTAPNSLLNPRIAHLFTPILWQSFAKNTAALSMNLPAYMEHGELPRILPHSAKMHLILFVSSEVDFISLLSFLSWL